MLENRKSSKKSVSLSKKKSQMKEVSCSSETCSRGLSRIASELVEKHIVPVLRYYNEEFLESCPYTSVCYEHKEKTKREIRSDRFRCGLCGKLFKSERHLDQHLDYRHSTRNHSKYCIADACSHLRCHEMRTTPNSLTSEERVRLARARSERCDESAMQSRREICEDIASSCFRSDTLRVEFMEEYCLSLTCTDTNVALPSLKRKLEIPETNHTIQNVAVFLVVFGILYYYLKLLFLKRRRMSADGLGLKLN